ncbi:MAG: lantibiotic mersacidin transporter system [Rhodopirellula sp.]|nr:lantibiotic mersacidin transporter system [Rhodopirellula sp.]
MIRFNTLARLRHEPEARGFQLSYLWSSLAGLLVPTLVILVGMISMLLDSKGLKESTVTLGTHLAIPLSEEYTTQKPLMQLTQLVGFTLLTATIFAGCVWLQRRSADARANQIVKSLHGRILKQSLRRAEVEGAAAQHVRANDIIGNQLPCVQTGLSQWYQAVPRSLLTLLGCVFLALLVNVWLAVLAVISGVLVRRFFRKLHQQKDTELTDWEVPRSRQRMASLVGQAPLLARLQSQGIADQAYQQELDSMFRKIDMQHSRQARIWPLVFLAVSTAIAVMILGLGVNLLGSGSGLNVPAALVLGLALGGAASAAGQLQNLGSQLTKSGEASDAIYRYLKRSDEVAPSEQRVGLAGLRDNVEIRDVTLSDSNGELILSHLSLELYPEQLIALMGTEQVSTRALTELLMGFGLPGEGRVSIDGIPLRDIHPQALARNVMWIEPDGPIWDGTILENLSGNDSGISSSDVFDALREVNVYERIQRLPEGLNTIVSANDSMLGVETTYGIAVARALLHKPPILLALEPPPPAEHMAEDPCLNAFKKLVRGGTLVVLLPRRLPSLRSADRVVLLNGARLAGEGNHGELLATSDLYRHLNYLLFNPYRHQKRSRDSAAKIHQRP